MAKEKKNSNQVNPQVSPESLRSRTQAAPELHVRRRVLSLHPLRVSSPPPSKVSDEYSGKY